MTNLELQKELQNANELIKELRNENDYKEAYIRVLQVAKTNILPYEMANALNFIKDNRLGGYENFFCAGEYLEEALQDYFEECGIDDLDSIARNNFNDWLRCEGLFIAIGEKALKEANAFLQSHGLNELEMEMARSDGASLWFEIADEASKKLKEELKELDFNALDEWAENESYGANCASYFALKCVLKTLELI